jgi:hypothetical protein
MPEEPIPPASPKRMAYLVETRSLGGTSGSPVFFKSDQNRVRRFKEPLISPAQETSNETTRRYVILPYLLVGMILGSHSGQYANDFISEDDTDIKPPKDADFNAGISVMMSALDILDFLENDAEPVAQRNLLIEKTNEKSGYRPSGASSARKGKLEASPTHKEDFTALLNAAAKKPQSKD